MTIETIIGRQETFIDYDVNSLTYDCEIEGHIVMFEGYLDSDTGYMKLLFSVDGTLERVDYSKSTKVAISRWLVACWKDALTKHSKFSCCATDDDGTGWRAAMYSKLGFVHQDGAMIYG